MPFIPEIVSERVDYAMESKQKSSELLSKIPVKNLSDLNESEKKALLDGWGL